jgi:hypothetical protein
VLREEIAIGINYLVERFCFDLGLLSKRRSWVELQFTALYQLL